MRQLRDEGLTGCLTGYSRRDRKIDISRTRVHVSRLQYDWISPLLDEYLVSEYSYLINPKTKSFTAFQLRSMDVDQPNRRRKGACLRHTSLPPDPTAVITVHSRTHIHG